MKLKRLLLIILVLHGIFVVQAQEFQEKAGTFISLSTGHFRKQSLDFDFIYVNETGADYLSSTMSNYPVEFGFVYPVSLGIGYIDEDFHFGAHIYVEHSVVKNDYIHNPGPEFYNPQLVTYQENGAYHLTSLKYHKTFFSIATSYHMLWNKSFSDLSIRAQLGINYNHDVRVQSTLDWIDNTNLQLNNRFNLSAALYLQYKVMFSKNFGCLMAIGVGRMNALLGIDYRTNFIN